MSTTKVGDRVIVCIPKHKSSEWARGAVDALRGVPGKITRATTSYAGPGPQGFGPKNPRDDKGSTRFLVEFDQPAATWWTGQTPPLAWWFDGDELMSETTPAARLPDKMPDLNDPEIRKAMQDMHGGAADD